MYISRFAPSRRFVWECGSTRYDCFGSRRNRVQVFPVHKSPDYRRLRSNVMPPQLIRRCASPRLISGLLTCIEYVMRRPARLTRNPAQLSTITFSTLLLSSFRGLSRNCPCNSALYGRRCRRAPANRKVKPCLLPPCSFNRMQSAVTLRNQ